MAQALRRALLPACWGIELVLIGQVPGLEPNSCKIFIIRLIVIFTPSRYLPIGSQS